MAGDRRRTRAHITAGYRGGIFKDWKCCATVIRTPGRVSKVSLSAPSLVSPRTTLSLSPVVSTLTRTPDKNFWSFILWKSLKVFPVNMAFGDVSGRRPKKSMHKFRSGPSLYIIPVERSMLTISRSRVGRTDWKMPCQSSIPPPISCLPSGM